MINLENEETNYILVKYHELLVYVCFGCAQLLKKWKTVCPNLKLKLNQL
jgi:hypothetical protein